MEMSPTANPLVAIRQRIGWPQVTMAQEMGLSLRAYQALEAGETPMRRIHQLAAERVALNTAWIQNRPDFVRGQIAREVIELARDSYGLPVPPVGPDFLPAAGDQARRSTMNFEGQSEREIAVGVATLLKELGRALIAKNAVPKEVMTILPSIAASNVMVIPTDYRKGAAAVIEEIGRAWAEANPEKP